MYSILVSAYIKYLFLGFGSISVLHLPFLGCLIFNWFVMLGHGSS